MPGTVPRRFRHGSHDGPLVSGFQDVQAGMAPGEETARHAVRRGAWGVSRDVVAHGLAHRRPPWRGQPDVLGGSSGGLRPLDGLRRGRHHQDDATPAPPAGIAHGTHAGAEAEAEEPASGHASVAVRAGKGGSISLYGSSARAPPRRG